MRIRMQPGNEDEHPLTPELFFEMLNGHQRTAALQAAIELDLFRAIGDGPGDAVSLARQCSASERGIRILCDFLTIKGLLLKEDGRYRHSPTSAVFLDPRSPACLAPTAKFLLNPDMLKTYDNLAEIVRSGHTTLPGDGNVEDDNPVWVEFAKSMPPMVATNVGPLAAFTLEGHTGPMHVLDIAAGHGLFGIGIAKQNPQARITALDWAHVLEVAKENAHKAGVQDRYETIPGSAFDATFGGPYDAVLLTNFLHHFDHSTNVSLLKKVRAALKPGGRAVTLEFVPNDDRISPSMPAAFSMVMLTTTPSGDAYTFKELSAMYTEAGFSNITSQPVPRSPETVVIGRA
jgi:2-polyprenyl-3-methyl-5-hydroxy-6-metoxy-1,4-benzoquinol methylase